MSSVPSVSQRASSFTASRSTRDTFLRSMASASASFSRTSRSISTCSPVIRPLMNNTTRFSGLTTRSILQLIAGFRFNPSLPLASRSGLRPTGFVKHLCRAQLLTHDSHRSCPTLAFEVFPGTCRRNVLVLYSSLFPSCCSDHVVHGSTRAGAKLVPFATI